jgi:hypothetical protein
LPSVLSPTCTGSAACGSAGRSVATSMKPSSPWDARSSAGEACHSRPGPSPSRSSIPGAERPQSDQQFPPHVTWNVRAVGQAVPQGRPQVVGAVGRRIRSHPRRVQPLAQAEVTRPLFQPEQRGRIDDLHLARQRLFEVHRPMLPDSTPRKAADPEESFCWEFLAGINNRPGHDKRTRSCCPAWTRPRPPKRRPP